MTKPFIIAEIGVNHNGSIEIAKKLILEAYIAGADAVKFQTFNSKKVVSSNTSLAEYQKINATENNQYDLIRKLELTKEEFHEIKNYSSSLGIDFISTPFDLDSLEFLVKELKVNRIKLSSCDLTNIALLWKAAKYNIPLIISTGMATLQDIETSLAIILHARTQNIEPKNLSDCLLKFENYDLIKDCIKDVTILHCTTSYPCPIKSVNLNAMLTIKEKYRLEVGYSDHSIGKEVCLAATSLGASILEKHFTLSREMQGPDHKSSMEPQEFALMVKSIRKTFLALGNFEKEITDSEKVNCEIAKRSIYARNNLKKGDVFKKDDLIALRPENIKAVPAKRFYDLIGQTSKKDILKGEPIPLEMLKN